jgi:hypothetical protein
VKPRSWREREELYERVPHMTDDLSRLLRGTTSSETVSNDDDSAFKLGRVVVVHKLLSGSATSTGSRV